MQQIIRGAIQARPARRTPHFSLWPFLFIALMLVVGISLAVVMVMTLARRMDEAYLSNPFAAVTDVFPGQMLDVRRLEAEGFSCWLDLQLLPSPSEESERCSRDLPTGPFSQIDIIIWDKVIRWINFAVRDNALTVGDLALLWGKPEVEINSSLIIVGWPDHSIMASGNSLNGHFTYFQSLSAISFSLATAT